MFRYDEATEKRIEESLASRRLPDRQDVVVRLLAYASEPVLDALRASGLANDRVEIAHADWKRLGEESKMAPPGAPPSGSDVLAAFKASSPRWKKPTARTRRSWTSSGPSCTRSRASEGCRLRLRTSTGHESRARIA